MDKRQLKKDAKKEKKERKRLKKDVKKAIKRARKSAGSSSSSSDGESAFIGCLPDAARWKPPPVAAVPLAGWNDSSGAALLPPSHRAAGPIRPLDMSETELRARADRANRFAPTDAEREMQERRAAPAPAIQAGKVYGQCLALEKSYLRLTTLPRADEVRLL